MHPGHQGKLPASWFSLSCTFGIFRGTTAGLQKSGPGSGSWDYSSGGWGGAGLGVIGEQDCFRGGSTTSSLKPWITLIPAELFPWIFFICPNVTLAFLLGSFNFFTRRPPWSLSEILPWSQFRALSCDGVLEHSAAGRRQGRGHRENGQQGPEKVGALGREAVVQTQKSPWSPGCNTPRAPSPLLLPTPTPALLSRQLTEWEVESDYKCLRPLSQASVAHPPHSLSFKRACLLFSPNRRGIQLHLSRQAGSPNLTSQGKITRTENRRDIWACKLRRVSEGQRLWRNWQTSHVK